jgi:hypothetical protein
VQIRELGDFRSGSITAMSGRCGKPNCRCHRPNQPGQGPNFCLTRKVEGKTVSETFAVTAFPVLARILTDRGRPHSELGVLALTCAAIDDVSA